MRARLVILLSLLLSATTAWADSGKNYLCMDDSTYEWYTNMCQHVFSPENLTESDSVLRVARARHDIGAEIGALQIKSHAVYGSGDLKGCLRVIDEWVNTSKNHIEHPGARRYYYMAMQLKVNVGMMTDEKFESFFTAKEMIRQSSEDHDEFGTFCSFYSMAMVYEMRNNFHSALQYYERCLKWAQEHPKAEASSWQVRILIANCLRCLNLKDEASRSGRLAVEEATTPQEKVRAEVYGLLFTFEGESDAEYAKRYMRISKLKEFWGMTDITVQRLSKINFCMATGNMEEALAIADSMNEDERLRARINIYSHFGQWENALKTMTTQQAQKDSIQSAVLTEDLAHLDVEMSNAILREQNVQSIAQMRFTILACALVVFVMLLAFMVLLSRRRLQHVKELEALNSGLDNANQMKTRFIQNVSHEIRTPLNAVSGFSQLLTADPSLTDEERKDLAERISQGTNQITRIVDEMLEVSDLESSGFKLECKPTRINDICRDALNIARPYLQSGVELSMETAFDDNEIANTDSRRVVQSLSNMLINACENTRNGTVSISVGLASTENHIAFVITDTGVGIPTEKADIIFNAFEKFDDFKAGAGLGLSICKMVATLLDGDVRLDRSYTNGARLVFEIKK